MFGAFGAALVLVSISGYVLTGQIERLGARLHVTPGLLGVLVALGADSPELASAISALVHGHGEVGTGVVLGSNVFNVAALLGVGAAVAHDGVRAGRAGLWLSGGVALFLTLVAAGLVVHALPAGWMFALACAAFVPYVVLASRRRAELERWPLPEKLRAFLCEAVEEVERDARPDRTPKEGRLLDALAVIPTIAAIVGGSLTMVKSALEIGARLHVPEIVLGTLILAGLTGIPNLVAAVHLARHGRGAAVVSETVNGNSLNIVFGLCLPAMLLGTQAPSLSSLLVLVWLLIITIAALVLTSRAEGLRRKGGIALLVLYVGFALSVGLQSCGR